MRIIRIISLVVVFCFRLISFGQEIKTSATKILTVTSYGADQGLRQSMVSGIIQDDMGLMWMTTGDGLHCFDGRTFTAYRVPVNGVFSHPDNLLGNIRKSGPGMLTITSSASVLQFNMATGKFIIRYRKEGSYPVMLQPVAGSEPLMWISGMKLCTVGPDRINPLKLRFEEKNGVPENFIAEHALRSSSGELLIAGNPGVILVETGKRHADSSLSAKYLVLPKFQAMAADKSGRVFILAGGKLSRYLGHGMTGDFFDTKLKGQADLFIDSRNQFWLTSRNTSKQYLFAGGSMQELRFYFREGKHADSISTAIRTVYEDDHHNIWLGTDGDGVLLYAPGQKQFLRSDIGFTRCMTWCNNEIWAGTHNNGLWRLSEDLRTARRVNSFQDFRETYYLDLAADRHGMIWAATRRGLEVYDHTGRQIFSRQFTCQSAKLVFGAGDTILLFTDTQLYRFSSREKPVLLTSGKFMAVTSHVATHGIDWYGTRFGLYRCGKKPGFDKDDIFHARNQVTDNTVYALLLHGDHVWSATGNGLEIFGPDGQRIPLPGKLEELQNEVIYTLLEDDAGQVWFSGNHGIGCISAEKDHIIYFRTGINLQSLEFNSNAACRAPGGKLFFGGIRGVNGFDPSWYNPGKKAEEVRLLSLFISDTAYTEGIPPAKVKIILGRHAPHISGTVFCPDYADGGSRLFSFYLEGHQQGWSKPSQQAEFTYRDLPPGKYRLLAKGAGLWQNWSEPVVLLEVTLSPPVWKTGWFLVLVITMIIVITALVVRKVNSVRFSRRIFLLEQQNAVEKERLRISRDMHDDLGASLTRISILSELAKQQQHDAEKSRLIIEQISGISGGVVDDMSEIIWAMNPRNDTLDSFTAYIRQYVSSYLESAGIAGRLTFPDEIPALPMSSELRRNLFLMVKEALHNIVKHSGATVVNIRLTIGGGELRIKIRDNGKGFNMEPASGFGNGLNNMRKRMEEHKGSFDISTEAGTGTTVVFSIGMPDGKKSH